MFARRHRDDTNRDPLRQWSFHFFFLIYSRFNSQMSWKQWKVYNINENTAPHFFFSVLGTFNCCSTTASLTGEINDKIKYNNEACIGVCVCVYVYQLWMKLDGPRNSIAFSTLSILLLFGVLCERTSLYRYGWQSRAKSEDIVIFPPLWLFATPAVACIHVFV